MTDPHGVPPVGATEAVRRLVAAADKHQGDLEEFLELHRSDVILVNFAGRRVLGRADLRQAMTAALDSPLARVLTRLEIQDIRFLRPDVALVSAIKHVSDQREAASGGDGQALPASQGSTTLVVSREPDGWRIASAQTTPLLSA